MAIPTRPGDLTAERLSRALGCAVSVEGWERIGSEYGFAGETYRVALGGFEIDFVAVKLWPMRSPTDDRELRFYRELAPNLPIPLPRFLGGDAHPGEGRGWLILEHLDGYRQGNDLIPESEASLGRIAVTLAAVHGATEGGLGGRSWLQAPARAELDPTAIAERHDGYVARFGPLPSGSGKDLFDALPRLLPEAHEALRTSPDALLHRDLGFDNILFRPPNDEPVILDWQRCEGGAGVKDLASILFTTTTASMFESIVRRYERAIADFGGRRLTQSALDAALILEFATRTLGVVRWAAKTGRGEAILRRWIEMNPATVAAWHSLDSHRFARMLGH